MIENLGNRVGKIQEMFNKDLEELKSNKQWGTTQKTKLKIFQKESIAEEQISDLDDKIGEITIAEQKKNWKELRTVLETSDTTLNAPTFEL